MALLKKRGYNEKWNNDDDVNHQSVTPFYRITTHASTNLHPSSGRASLSPDPVSSGPLYAEARPGALDDTRSEFFSSSSNHPPHCGRTSCPHEIITAETHRRQLSILFIHLAYYRRPWEVLFGLSGGARLFGTVD